jgi:hypothetical protein
MSAGVSESTVEAAALDWLAQIGWEIRFGPAIGPGESPPSATATKRSFWLATWARRSTA